MRRLVRGLTFCFSAALAMAACHAGMCRLGLYHHHVRPAVPPPLGDQFLSNYNHFGLDFIWLRHNVLGISEPIRQADIICSSSSKGMFGIDAALLSRRLSRPGQPVRVYNLAFPYCESFAYLMEVIKSLDLHDKILLADVTDQTSVFKLSNMGAEAMRTTNQFDAYKLLLERSLGFWRDWLLTGLVPRFEFDRQKGFVSMPPFVGDTIYRCRATGDHASLPSSEGEPLLAPTRAHWTFEFEYSKFKEPFFEECRRRNIRIVFTSIPFVGYDPEFGAAVARALGLPHARVDDRGIFLGRDPVHLHTAGRKTFTERLGDCLLSPEIDIQQRIAQVRAHRTSDSIELAARPNRRAGRTQTSDGAARRVSYDAPLGGEQPPKPAANSAGEPNSARRPATPPPALLK